MQSVTEQLAAAFKQAIVDAFGVDADPLLAPSQNDKFGDYQSNAAMGLSKKVSQNPRAVAGKIKEKLNLGPMASEISIAGPGFINVRLDPQWVASQLAIITSDERLGIDRVERPQNVVIDYSSPNIAKEMHVGHIRSTIIGDALARVIAFQGHNVIPQNHIGDWGTQFGKVVLAMWYEAVFDANGRSGELESLMFQQQQATATKSAAEISTIVNEIGASHQQFIEHDPDGERWFLPFLHETKLDLAELERAYQFVSAITESERAKEIVINHPQDGPLPLADIPRRVTTYIQTSHEQKNRQERLAWEKAKEISLRATYGVYDRLRVMLQPRHEKSESSYNDDLAPVVAELQKRGIAQESDGAVVVPVEGFEAPLIIEKSGGGFLYGTTDLAAIRYRVEKLHADRVIYLVDSRQSQHFAQVFAVARRAGWVPEKTTLEHAAFGTMLGSDKRPFKTRSGDVVKLKDLLDEAEERAAAIIAQKNPQLPEAQRLQIAHAVGIGAIKYADLSKDRVSDYVFSWDQMLSFEGNTAPYLQNAYVRIRSIFRKAGVEPSIDARIRLETPHELALAKHLLRLGDVIEVVSRELKPHHLCTYLFDLATRFHAFYEHCPVLQSEEPTRSSRLALCNATARTLALGLELLGIEHPEQM